MGERWMNSFTAASRPINSIESKRWSLCVHASKHKPNSNHKETNLNRSRSPKFTDKSAPSIQLSRQTFSTMASAPDVAVPTTKPAPAPAAPHYTPYKAFYSTVSGQFVSDYSLMNVPFDDHMVHRYDTVWSFGDFIVVMRVVYI